MMRETQSTIDNVAMVKRLIAVFLVTSIFCLQAKLTAANEGSAPIRQEVRSILHERVAEDLNFMIASRPIDEPEGMEETGQTKDPGSTEENQDMESEKDVEDTEEDQDTEEETESEADEADTDLNEEQEDSEKNDSEDTEEENNEDEEPNEDTSEKNDEEQEEKEQ
ncbi:hypothetical protein ACFL9U_06065 [Thermodesulfobacteriota bacterium]